MTEEIIKKSVVQYLKSYYKYRPRFQNDETLAPTLAQTDMMTSNGIFADGHLSFLDDKGKMFVATFEASGTDSAFEVKYRLEKNLLFWDAIAVSALVVAFSFSYAAGLHYDKIQPLNGGWVFGGLLFIFLIVNILYRFGMKNLERYRSIFAIEQFKQYYADEQWIAIGKDTFSTEDEKYIVELKKQCVYNGFGLLEVDDDFDVQLLITPAREVVYGTRRPKVTFFTSLMENNYTQRAVSWSQQTTQRIIQPLTDSSLLRFHRPYYNQWALTALSSIIFSAIFYRFINDKNVIVADTADQKTEININDPAIPENENVDDSLHLRRFQGEKGNVASSTDIFTEKGNAQNGVHMMDDNGNITFYDCERLQLEAENFVIMDSKQSDLAHAKQKMEVLKSKGMKTSCVWLGCFLDNYDSYIVFYDLIYTNKNEAEKKAAEIYNLLNKKKLDASNVKITSLKNPN